MNTSYHCRRLRTIMRPITQHTLNYFPRWSNNKHFIIVVMPGSWPESILLSSGPGLELCLRGRCRPLVFLFRSFSCPLCLVIIPSRRVWDTSQFVETSPTGTTWASRCGSYIQRMYKNSIQQYRWTGNIRIKQARDKAVKRQRQFVSTWLRPRF